jgi:TusA-related sulfurtransferase
MTAPAAPLDLRGTPCPLNYVKTRLALDRLAAGDVLEVWLDRGEPETQVPRSLRMDGHAVEVLADGSDHVRLRVVRASGEASQ